MYPHCIFIAECLSVVVDGAEGQSGGVEGIDAHVRRATGVGATANELDLFGHGAVVGATDTQLALIGSAGGVEHHGQVDVVELAQLDQFRFASQEFQLTFSTQGVPVFDFDIFFGGHRHQYNPARQG